MSAHLERLERLGMSRPAFFVPGRIEVLGKHTDYAGGRSLLCAVDRGILMSVTPRADSMVRVTDAGRGESREVRLDSDARATLGDWANYVATVVRRVARNFSEARTGADITFTSDLPVASGLSSSSALVVAIFLALDRVNGLADSPEYRMRIGSREDLAAYLSSVEMGGDFGSLAGDAGVGTLGGSEDHTAILCCQANALSQYSFLPTRHERTIPFPNDLAFVVAFSGVGAEKTGSALDSYNEASLALRRVLAIWNTSSGRTDRSIADAVASDPEAAMHMRLAVDRAKPSDFPAKRLRERLVQFFHESDTIIPRAAEAFARGDLGEFSAQVDQSQVLAETMLGNQVPETIALVRLAREYGAIAASAFGAGFGGSVWALTEAAGADAFLDEWRRRYAMKFPEQGRRSEFFVTRPGPGATSL